MRWTTVKNDNSVSICNGHLIFCLVTVGNWENHYVNLQLQCIHFITLAGGFAGSFCIPKSGEKISGCRRHCHFWAWITLPRFSLHPAHSTALLLMWNSRVCCDRACFSALIDCTVQAKHGQRDMDEKRFNALYTLRLYCVLCMKRHN